MKFIHTLLIFVLLLTSLVPFYYKRISKEAVSEYEQHIVRLLRFGHMAYFLATFCCFCLFRDTVPVFIFVYKIQKSCSCKLMSHLETAEVEYHRKHLLQDREKTLFEKAFL